jgi:hypothetical protein
MESVDPKQRHLIASGLIGVFKKIWADSWGPRLEYILRNGNFEELQSIFLAIYNKKIDFHNFLNSLPRLHVFDNGMTVLKEDRKLYCTMEEKERKIRDKEVFSEIMRRLLLLLKTNNSENLLKLLPYLNYKRLFIYSNTENRLMFVSSVFLAILAKKKSLEDSILPSTDTPLIGKVIDELNPNSYQDLQKSKKIYFSKNPSICSSLGELTGCCYRKGGIGEKDLVISIKNPIAGNLIGYREAIWFSFIWEYIELDSNDNLFKINLVLDNIESKKDLPFSYLVEELFPIFNNLNLYSAINLGTSRNDVKNIPASIMATSFNKTIQLVKYEKRNSFDDSASMWNICSVPLHYSKETNKIPILIKRMDISDIYRCKYLENVIYGKESDNDFVNYQKSYIKDISFIWSNNQIIVGYLFIGSILKKHFTSLGISLEEEEIDGKIITKIPEKLTIRNINGKEVTVNSNKIITIYDFFLYENKEIIISAKSVFREIKKYIIENKIEAVECSFNEKSFNFAKRIEELGIEVFSIYNLSHESKTFMSTKYNFEVFNRINDRKQEVSS